MEKLNLVGNPSKLLKAPSIKRLSRDQSPSVKGLTRYQSPFDGVKEKEAWHERLDGLGKKSGMQYSPSVKTFGTKYEKLPKIKQSNPYDEAPTAIGFGYQTAADEIILNVADSKDILDIEIQKSQ